MTDNKSSNTIQAMWVALGSFASFGFAIISSMILSRYLTKDDYGTYKQVMYVYSTLLFLFTMGLPRAFSYFIPRIPPNEGYSLVKKITRVFFIMGGLFSLILFCLSDQIAEILNNKALGLSLKIFSIAPFFMLPTLGLEAIYASVKETHISAIYTVTTRVLMLVFVALPVIIWKGNANSALVGFNVSSLICFVIALYLKKKPFAHIEERKCSVSYKEIYKFSLPLMVASLWGILIKSSDQFFISRYFGTEVFAEFSNGFMELPFIGMIVGACSTVLLPVFSKIDSQSNSIEETRKQVYSIWISVFNKTALIVYPILLFCWFYADDLMILLYGKLYINSGIYFKIALIANIFTLIAFAPLIMALGKTKSYSNVLMISAIILIVLEYVVVITTKSPYIIAIVSVLCHIGRIFAMLCLISNYFNMSVWALLPVKLACKILVPSAVFLYIYSNIISLNNYILNLSIGFVGFLIFYCAYAYIMKLDYRNILLPIFKSLS